MCDSSSFWALPPHQFKDILGYLLSVGPAALTAWLGWVARNIAKETKDATQAQKDIASNQYKISLYQLRREALDGLQSWINQNKEYDFKKYEKYKKIISLIQYVDSTFDENTNLEKINDYLTQIKTSDERVRLSQIPGMPPRHFDLNRDREYATCQAKASVIYSDLVKELETIALALRNSLKVPSRPY